MARQILIGLNTDGGAHGRAVHRGVGRYATRHGRPWLIRPVGIQQIEAGWRPAGMVISQVDSGDTDWLRSKGCLHVVNISARLTPLPPCTVCMDNTAVGRLAARHLIERGLERFMTFTPAPAMGYAILRVQGFMTEIHAAGRPCEMLPFCPGIAASDIQNNRRKTGSDFVRWARSQPLPMGVFCVDDKQAQAFIGYCVTNSIAIPGELAVVGSDNSEQAELGSPSISSVELGAEVVGYEAAHRLDLLLRGEPVPPHPVLIEPVGVVARESSAINVARDRYVIRALRHIEAKVAESLSVPEVAREVGISRRWLERRFRHELGRSVLHQIHKRKVERAKILMTDPRLKLSDIARKIGLHDARMLTLVFRRVTGLTPSYYRQRQGHQE